MKEGMLWKDLTVEAVKDVDTVQGIVTGYFSIFGNTDSDGDIVMPGAYRKTLKENGPESSQSRILHLYQHDPFNVLAKPHVLKEDKKGLYFESKISHTVLGKDILQLYIDKVLTEHSIGYQIIKSEFDEKNEVQRLTELKLWEGSTVSWGANMEALVETVKADTVTKDQWSKLFERMDTLEKAVKGNYTDETARQIEIYLKQIQQLIISLARKAEPEESTPAPEEPDYDKLFDKLKI